MKILPVFLFCLGASLLLGCTSGRTAGTADGPDPDFHLYLLVGQSNMAGRGEVDAESREGHPRVLMLNKANEWVPATDPLHFDKPPVVGVGPGLAFGKQMAAQSPGARIGLIPCAVGGSPISVWQPGRFYQATGTHPYDEALARAQVALRQGVLKGIVWHQGESDSSPEMAAAYLPKLEQLVQTFRRDLNAPEVPFVAGELGYFRERYQSINHQLRRLPKRVPRSAVASAEGLAHKGDETHFDTSSARKLGQRFAEKMAELQGKR
jgi:hypothetical protein